MNSGEACDACKWVSEGSRWNSLVPEKPRRESHAPQLERHVVLDLCFSKPERPPAISVARPGSAPRTSLSALSALRTLHTPVTYTEQQGINPAFPILGLSSGPPHPLRRPTHCPILSLGSKGLTPFSFPASRTQGLMDTTVLGRSQRWHQARSRGWAGGAAEEMCAKWQCSVARLTRAEASLLSLFSSHSHGLSSSQAWPLPKPPKCLGLVQGRGSQPPLHVISTLWIHFTNRSEIPK